MTRRNKLCRSCRHYNSFDGFCRLYARDTREHCTDYAAGYSWLGPGIKKEDVPRIRAHAESKAPALRVFVGAGRAMVWGWSLIDR